MNRRSTQQGYFLVLAVIFIMVMGVMGTLIAYNSSTQARLSADQYYGLKTFYNAESGLEIATRYLSRPGIVSTPSRIACGSVTGNGQLTNASLNGGTFTVTTVSSPVFATSTLSSGMTAGATSFTAASASGFAPTGALTIDHEVMNYAAISSNTFLGVTRGVGGTSAVSHASGAGIGQYQCSLDVQAGIPSMASPTYQRELQRNVNLQYGWAVANEQSNSFTVINWNHSSELNWSASLLPAGSSSANLNAISMLSEADGWAVGDRAANSFIFLHWNGASWVLNSIAGSCSGQHLLGVSMTSSSEGYAVGVRYRESCGGSGARRYTVMRWNGSTWSLLTPSSSPSIPADDSANQNLNAVHVIDTSGTGYANVGFAVGDNGTILRYNGSNWVTDSSPVTQNLNGVYTVSTSEAWAVGASGRILKWNGSTWSSMTSPVSTLLRSITMFDSNGDGLADYGIAVGNSSKILTYDGSSWNDGDLGNTTFFTVDLFNKQDAWVGGDNGSLYHWDGNSWTSFNSGTSRPINGIGLVHSGNQITSIWRQIFR